MDNQEKIDFLKDLAAVLRKHDASIDVDLNQLKAESISFVNNVNLLPYFTTECLNPDADEIEEEVRKLENQHF